MEGVAVNDIVVDIDCRDERMARATCAGEVEEGTGEKVRATRSQASCRGRNRSDSII